MGLRPGYKRTEVGVIPVDWECTTVSGIASRVRNAIVGGPFGSDLVSADYQDDGVPVIRGQNMAARHVAGSFVFVSLKKANSLQANLAYPGDLIFTQRGTLGQVSLVPAHPYRRYLVSQSQMKVTPDPVSSDPLFFYYSFTSEEQKRRLLQSTEQTGVPHITLGILRKLPVPKPHRHEQEAIAAALSDADALIESLKQLIAKQRHLKQGAMQGFLHPRDGDEVRQLREVSSLKGRIGWQGLKEKEFTANEDDPFLITGMNFRDGEVQWDGVYHVPEERYQLAKDIQLRETDVLMTKDGTIGKMLYVEAIPYPGKASLNSHLLLFRPINQGYIPKYLYYQLTSRRFSDFIELNKSGTTFFGISQSAVGRYPVVLPPVQEQVRIASILSDMDAEIAALEAKLNKARQIKQGMMQNLLTGRIRLV